MHVQAGGVSLSREEEENTSCQGPRGHSPALRMHSLETRRLEFVPSTVIWSLPSLGLSVLFWKMG